MLLGVHTGLLRSDFCSGYWYRRFLPGVGLAVGRASGFVGRAWSGLLDGFYTALIDHVATCLAGWRRKVFVLNLRALAGSGGPQRVFASVSYQQMRFSAEQLRNTTHLGVGDGGNGAGRRDESISGKEAVNNVSAPIVISTRVSDAAITRDLRSRSYPPYNPSFYHHPTPFAVNGGFANQTKTVNAR